MTGMQSKWDLQMTMSQGKKEKTIFDIQLIFQTLKSYMVFVIPIDSNRNTYQPML